jgi:hypothetical protein
MAEGGTPLPPGVCGKSLILRVPFGTASWVLPSGVSVARQLFENRRLNGIYLKIKGLACFSVNSRGRV